MAVFSQPTGTNDFIPTFAHSRWSYSLSGVDIAKLRKGETLLLYTGSTRPNVYNELPAYQLQLASANGDALPTEIIAYMSVNTQGTTSRIGYLLQYAGYINSVIGFNRIYGFKNSKERVIQNNLYSNTFAISGTVAISNTGFNSTNILDTPLITGFALDSSITTANGKLDTINTSITNKTLSKTTSSIDISGQTVAISNTGFNVNNQISGFALDSSITTANGKLDTINTTITNKTLSKTTSSIDISGQTVAISNTGFNSTNILDTPLITGFATETTLAGIKTQTDKLIFVGDDLKSVISNTSFESSLIDADGDKITTTTSGIAPNIIRALDINVVNSTQANPLNVLVDTTAPLNVSVNNYPTTYEITAGAPLSSVANSLFTNLRDINGDAFGVDGNPIFVSSSGSTADGKAYLYNTYGKLLYEKHYLKPNFIIK
jgi:hypothetical protein